MAKVARKQVNAEKKRLIEARNIANSEKRLYVKVVFCISFFVYLYILSLFIPRGNTSVNFGQVCAAKGEGS